MNFLFGYTKSTSGILFWIEVGIKRFKKFFPSGKEDCGYCPVKDRKYGITKSRNNLTIYTGVRFKEIFIKDPQNVKIYTLSSSRKWVQLINPTVLCDLKSIVTFNIEEIGVKGYIRHFLYVDSIKYFNLVSFIKKKRYVNHIMLDDNTSFVSLNYYYKNGSIVLGDMIEDVLQGETLKEFIERIKIKIINAYKEKDNTKSKEHEVL